MKNTLKKKIETVLPVILGVSILFWIYKDFELKKVAEIFIHEMSWNWMFVSLLFGILSHIIRGVRWKLALKPLGYKPNTHNCINSIFVSYAANLVIPRIGEVSRCGILAKYDKVDFAKSVGTVIAERCIDTLSILMIIAFTILLQPRVFAFLFDNTGADYSNFVEFLYSGTFYVILASIVAVIAMLYLLARRFKLWDRVRSFTMDIWTGIASIKKVEKPVLYAFYTFLIWLCYFMHFYVTLFCFDFSSGIGLLGGLVMFVAGSIAVIVPTPNGAGPWHFAIISIMTMYGVGREDAGIFALIVHTTQTFLLILLGIYGLVALPLTNNRNKNFIN